VLSYPQRKACASFAHAFVYNYIVIFENTITERLVYPRFMNMVMN